MTKHSFEVAEGHGGLKIDSLRKSYSKRLVVRDVSMQLHRGEVVALLGPNGSGKTTCFYSIAGLIAPESGKVSIDGRDVTRLPMYRRARLGIGYLPQEISIFRGMTVENNILAVLELSEPDRKRRYERLEELLNEFSIDLLRRTPALALSGGERRRVEIARCLAANPKYLLLDEPFAGVDPISVIDIQNIIRQLADRNIGVLITDHNVRETLGICDRAYVMGDGVILTEGDSKHILENKIVRKIYLGKNFKL
jgi:lipopolysaccharide export system ATP-binding protein